MTPVKYEPWNPSSQPHFPGGERWGEGVVIAGNGVQILEAS